jgi:hypothetical protein
MFAQVMVADRSGARKPCHCAALQQAQLNFVESLKILA